MVYKGHLHEKSNASVCNIAVKRLFPEYEQCFKERLAELNFMGRLSHPNLVKILGYCWENGKLLLVNEFMQKGSLENHIFGSKGLDDANRITAFYHPALPWNIRLKILIGAARGLEFLHSEEVKVIHGDFKPSNILLDASYHAKLSDFGLVKSDPQGEHTHACPQFMVNPGYTAPEYIATGHLYVQTDVYSFGVILLEMLTGLRAIDHTRPSVQRVLVDWITPQLSDRNKSMKLMDPRLEGRYPPKSAVQIFQLARNCLENERKARPSMKEVVGVLERTDSSDEKPREPRVRFDHPVASALRQ